MTATETAIISAPGDGRVVEAFGTNIIRIDARQTGASLSVMEVVLPGGAGTPLHVHEREDETFRVLNGRFGFWCGDDYSELTEGGVIFLPRKKPHRIQNLGSSDGKVMVMLTPGGFEQFFERIASGEDPMAVAGDFGLLFS